MTTQASSKRLDLMPAVVAGILGGVVVDAFLSLAMHTSPVSIWQYVASTIVGKGAFASPAYAVLGFLVHFIVSIVWAIAYAAIWGSFGQLKNWILGALVWGVVVDAGMQLLLLLKTGAPFGPAFVGGLLAHIVFYMVPVALYLARSERRA